MNFFAIEFKKLNTVVLEQPDDNFIQTPISISVLDDKFIYINDQKAVNIKIYDSKGKYIKSFGKRGTGPNEFMSMGGIYIDKKYLLIIDGKRNRDNNLLRRLTSGMSYTMGVFTINKDYIGLPFSKYVKKTDSTDVYIQIYKTSGEFISESKVFEGKSFYSGGIRLYFDKLNKLLYILDTETTEDFDQIFRVHKYKVIL